MTGWPVRAETPANALPFPVDQRVLLAGWNLLFLRPGRWQSDPAHDARWNRGAYLVQAVGHCGACHSGRNAFGAEERASAWPADRRMDGTHRPHSRPRRRRFPGPKPHLPPICVRVSSPATARPGGR